jgi:hypothetical protein
MIISHEHKFIFLKTRKTAGSSIEVFLAGHLGPDAIVTPIDPPSPDHEPRNYERYFNPVPELRRALFAPSGPNSLPRKRRVKRPLSDLKRRRAYYNHIDAQRIRDRVGSRVWNSYFKFCFERDPWEKVQSLYYFLLSRPDLKQPSSFEEMVLRGKLPADWGFYSIDGTPVMDFIGRYENLSDDLTTVLQQVGIDVPVVLPREKTAARAELAPRDPVEFTPELDARIALVFSREIAKFGYEDRSKR